MYMPPASVVYSYMWYPAAGKDGINVRTACTKTGNHYSKAFVYAFNSMQFLSHHSFLVPVLSVPLRPIEGPISKQSP